MLSYWERKSFTNYDYIIIGSGITGLSVAAELIEKNPNWRILVLERGVFPTGASTKNAGFACIGSPSELLSDLKTMSQEQVVELVTMRYQGLQLLRKRLGDKAIQYAAKGSYELLSEQELYCLDQLPFLNDLLEPILHTKVFELDEHIIPNAGFEQGYFKVAISNLCEAQLNTGAMMQSLLQYVQKAGVQIINGAEVLSWNDQGQSVNLLVKHQLLSLNIEFSAKKIAICTNAFTKQLLPHIDLEPGRGQVIITEPIAKLPFKGVFHFNEGFYYFRELEQRILFGGGRNLDFKAENSTEFAFNEHILDDLTDKLRRYILPNFEFTIDMRWTGIMGFGTSKQPYLFTHSPNVVVGVKLSGMGIAIGSKLAKQVAELMLL